MKHFALVCCVLVLFVKVQAQKKYPKIIGDWTVHVGERMFRVDAAYNHLIEPMTNDEMTFLMAGVLHASSGFFYINKDNAFLEGEGTPGANYPWIYCGNFARYELDDRILKVLHPGYNQWLNFE
jgi:hypothetical protein